MFRRPRLFAALSAVVAVLPLLLLGAQPAYAQPTSSNWFVGALPNFPQSNLHIALNGNVTQVSCFGQMNGSETTGPYSYTYSSIDGAPESNLSGVFQQNETECESSGAGGGAIGADGTVYNASSDHTASYANKVVASKDGVVAWTLPIVPPAASNCTNNPYVEKIMVGADQDIYFIVKSGGYACNYAAFLFGVNADTGAIKFQAPLVQDGFYQLGIYNTGIAVYWLNYGEEFRFFDYNGVENVQMAFDPVLASNENLAHWAIHPDGTMYMTVQKSNDTTCTSGGTITNSVIRRDLTGTEYIYDVSGYCMQVVSFGISPNGGAVFLGTEANGYGQESLVYLYPDNTTSMVGANRKDGRGLEYYRGFNVDMRGNVLTMQQVNNPQNNPDLYFTLFGPNGSVLAEYSTLSLRANEYEKFNPGEGTVTAVANGAVYTTICYANEYGEDCGVNPSYQKLLKVGFAEVDFEYPETAILGYQASPSSTLNYVALGDSFSSGEGVPDFIPPSDTNGCHKSYDAYANLLSEDPSFVLSLTNFAACSGAISDDVTEIDPNRSPQYGLPLQTVSIPSDTDVITISIGGNDVAFKEYAISCVNPLGLQNCGLTSTQYIETQNRINNDLPSRLAAVYAAIRAEAPSAHIYVLGYPHLVPFLEEGYEPGTCRYLDAAERVNARDVVTNLNYTISTAVDAADVADGEGNGFTFVSTNDDGSPFIGHELCSADPYFNDLSYPVDYTFHPNAVGHQKYADILKEAMG